jgi:hypothetical protein
MLKSTNTESGVKRKAPNEGHRTMGFFMPGDGTFSAHKKVMIEKASLYATAIQRSSVWKGEYGLAYNSFYLPSIGYSNPPRMLQHTKTSHQCHFEKWGLAGKLIGASFSVRLSLADLKTSSRIPRSYWSVIFNGSSPLQQHHRPANAINAGLYTIRMWMFGKCNGARLRKVFTGFHDGKLDYRNLGTLALV